MALKIETVTLVNGARVEELGTDKYLGLIAQEERYLGALDVVTVPSTAIEKLRAKHKSNINELIKLLDASMGDA